MEKKIENIAENALNGRNVRLIDIGIRGEKKNKIVEIFVDSPGNLSLDELTDISRDINTLIDESDIKGELLKVVVSSPGADRPFKFAWQAAKHVNKLFEFGSGEEKYSGKLLRSEGDDFVFEVKSGKKEITEKTVKFSELDFLKVKLPF